MSVPENKEVFVTSGDDVIGIGTEHGMSQCNHEEADTRIIIHVQDSLQRGSDTIMVRTVDTDVVVLLVGHFYSLRDQHPQVLIYGWPLEQVNIFATIISTLSVQILVWRGVGHFPLSMHSLDATQHPLLLAAAKNLLGRLGVLILRLQRLSFTLLSTHMSPSVFLLSIFSLLKGSQWYCTTNPVVLLQ